jgi:hypothetical protein
MVVKPRREFDQYASLRPVLMPRDIDIPGWDVGLGW